MKFDIEVWFGDLDAFGHVNNVALARYLETARVKFFMEKFGNLNATFVVRRLEIDFTSPLFLGEVAEVEIKVGNISSSSWEFLYTIREKKSGRVVVEAKSIQVWVDLKENRKMPIPDEVKKILEKER